MDNINVSILTGKSKKGNEFQALKVRVGEYEGLLFPTKIELLYLKNLLEKKAHNDFKGEDED